MKRETTSDMPPREVVAEALATLADEQWTLRSASESHVHLAGAKRRNADGLKIGFVVVLLGYVVLMLVLWSDPTARIGERQMGEVVAFYSLIAWPAVIVALVFHFLVARGEAGIVVAALARDGGGSRVVVQAYGSAFAVEAADAFAERMEAPRGARVVASKQR